MTEVLDNLRSRKSPAGAERSGAPRSLEAEGLTREQDGERTEVNPKLRVSGANSSLHARERMSAWPPLFRRHGEAGALAVDDDTLFSILARRSTTLKRAGLHVGPSLRAGSCANE